MCLEVSSPFTSAASVGLCGGGEGKPQGGKSQLCSGCALAPCTLSAGRWQSSAERLSGTDVGQISHGTLPDSAFKPQLSRTEERATTSRLKSQTSSSGKGALEVSPNFNIRSGCSGTCSVKIWKSPRTVVLQPVLAHVPLLIYPHYENIFLLCPTKHFGSPKLLQIQPQKCQVEGNNNLLWPAGYTLIIAAGYVFSLPCCKGMLADWFSTFAHQESLVFFKATPQPASPHPVVLHGGHFNRWKTLRLSLLIFMTFLSSNFSRSLRAFDWQPCPPAS